MSGTTIDNLISGKEMTAADLGWGALTGGAFTQLPGGPTQMSTLRQMPYFQPSTLAGAFRGANGGALWSSAGTGAGVGGAADLSRWGLEQMAGG